MNYFFWFCLSLIIPGLLVRIPFGGGGILLTDIFLPIFAICYLCKKIFLREKFPKNSFFFSGLFLVFILFLSWLLGSFHLDFKAKILSFSYIIRIFSMLVFALFSLEFFTQKKLKDAPQNKYLEDFSNIDLKKFNQIFKIIFVVILLAFVQFFFLPNIATFSTLGGWDPHIGRLLGTWMDPNYLGGFLAFVIPFLVAQIYHSKIPQKQKALYFVLLLFFIFALLLTFSRSAYLALVVGIFFFFCIRDPKIILLGIIVSIIFLSVNPKAQKRVEELGGTIKSVVFFDTDEIDPTASLRIENWGKSFELFQKYPILGIGYNTYRFRAAEEGVVDESFFSAGGADSTPLTILVTSGIIGFLAFLLFFGQIFFLNLFRYFETKNPIFLGFCSGLLAINIHALFVNSLFFPFIFLYIMVFLGLVESLEKKSIHSKNFR